MNGMASVGVLSGGVGVLLIGWRAYETCTPAYQQPIVVQTGSGRSARTEVIYAAPPPQYGAQYGWGQPVQAAPQGYGYGPPPSANYGPNGFGGGFPGYPQPGGSSDAGSFNDATGGNVF